MRGISHVWLRFAFALLLTLAVTALTFPRSIGLTRTASLETISPGQGLLYEAPWPRSLRRPSQRTILPEEKPSLTENGQVLGVWVSKRSAIEQVGAGRFRFTGNKGAVFQLRRHITTEQWTNLRRLHREFARSRTTTSALLGNHIVRVAFLTTTTRKNNCARNGLVPATAAESVYSTASRTLRASAQRPDRGQHSSS
jgi:hypothetical protein